MEFQRTVTATMILACLAPIAVAQVKKEYRYAVRPGASVSIETQYGAISVKPGSPNQVLVVASPRSDKVVIDNLQEGNRIEIESQLFPGADAETGRVDYEITVPRDAAVILRSATGPLSASGLLTDLTLEGAAASVDVRDVIGIGPDKGHVHVKTLNGSILLSGVTAEHVEISSIDGPIHLVGVSGNKVDVNSTSGKILFEGGLGAGTYSFVTHTGDIEMLVPANASADFHIRSMHGTVDNEVALRPEQRPHPIVPGMTAFQEGTLGNSASKVVLQSFSGKIHLKRQR